MHRILLGILLSVFAAVPIVQAGETPMSPRQGAIKASPDDASGARRPSTQARDMAEDDLDTAEEEEMDTEVAAEQAVDEDLVDPALAAEITEEKMRLVDPEAILPLHAGCGIVPRDRDSTVTRDAAAPNAARQRSGSSTSCITHGVLQPSDDAGYFCFTVGHDGFTWTYLRNRRTGVRGWTRDDLLRDRGSFVYCGF